jgi:hypothetical protein
MLAAAVEVVIVVHLVLEPLVRVAQVVVAQVEQHQQQARRI